MSSSPVAYAAALGLAAAIPGRGVAALVGQLLGSGLRSGLFLLAGIPAGDVVYLTVAVAGLAGIAQAFAGIFLIMKILGGAYLLFLALKLWGGKVGPQAVGASPKGTGFGVFLTGFSVTMGNPKTIAFYLALLPAVIDLQKVGLTQWAVLAATLSPYAVLSSRARGMMTRADALDRLNRLAAGIIGATGVLILGQAASMLLRRTQTEICPSRLRIIAEIFALMPCREVDRSTLQIVRIVRDGQSPPWTMGFGW